MINSILDNDLYKFTMQLAVLELFPKAEAEYRFTNRGPQRFSTEFVEELERIIDEEIPKLKLTEEEYYWLSEHCPYLKPMYLEYLKNFRFKPERSKSLPYRRKRAGYPDKRTLAQHDSLGDCPYGCGFRTLFHNY